MHQSHNIAWDSLTSNLTFITENPVVTPRRTDFFPRGLPSQANSLNHFARTVATTIRTSSDTERAKYPTRFDAPLQGKLFPDSILERYSRIPASSVTPKSQLIEHWIERAGPTPSYNTGQGDLADVVKSPAGRKSAGPAANARAPPAHPAARTATALGATTGGF
ncbi:hypothetical protein B0H14DRAFT_3452526 [Mycena olivaceomarginata]|nr:hypothetical protein B0H14DRAFT_3452526 [Mycena olivaceomarginata]